MELYELNRMFEQLTLTPEQERDMLDRLLRAKRKEHPMKKWNTWKRLTAAGIAAALLAGTCAAAVMTGVDQRLIDFLGGGAQAQELLAPGAQPVDVMVEDNGASLHVTQVLMDRYSVLALADFTAPEGTVLNMDEEREDIRRGFSPGDDLSLFPYLLDQAGEPLGLAEGSHMVRVLDDGDPQDNHLSLLVCLWLDHGIQPDWDIKELFLPAVDLVRYDPELEREVTVYSGDWTCRVPLTWQDMGRDVPMDRVVGQTDGVNIVAADVYLSPMTLQIRLGREIPVSPEDSRTETDVYTRWLSAFQFDRAALTGKDGRTIPLTHLGGVVEDQDQSWRFQLEEITDPARLQTLTLYIGEERVDIPLDAGDGEA